MHTLVGIALVLTSLGAVPDEAAPYVGRWALTIPGGGAGWLGVTADGDYLDASILWGGGSVVPVANVYVDTDAGELVVTRLHKVDRKDDAGTVIRSHTITEKITAKVNGDDLALVRHMPRSSGAGVAVQEFQGKRIPAMPSAPDLSQVKFGDAINLIKGNSLDGWTLTNERARNGWRVENGILMNEVPERGGAYGNLRTVEEFEDFNLTLEVNVPKDGNSGVYLRGIYEVQVLDSHSRPLDSHHMGAIYSRIAPAVAAEKPAGEWQTMDITLVDRHVTVRLNGVTIIDNQPLLGCTGGALWSDEFRPGPIYLQGDHGPIQYRNMVIRPVEH